MASAFPVLIGGVKRGHEVWELEVSGLPLGLTDSAEYSELTIDLQ